MPERDRPKGGTRPGGGPPRWPSLEEQLVKAKVRRGSKLEQLISDNQDFGILHPNEASDGLDYPPWLRVHWRKTHPEMRYSPEDPSGGYPRVLERIYAWLLQNQDMPEQR